MTHKATILQKAEFNPKIKTYLYWYGVFISLVTVIAIPLLPFWLIASPYYLRRYFDHLECELSTRSLRFKKGIIFQTERTIPLDKIQDLTFKEGPLLKYFGLSILKIETAGNTGQGTADLSLIGIVDAMNFRNRVFEQRDNVTDNQLGKGNASDESVETILSEIRDSLQNIERKLIDSNSSR